MITIKEGKPQPIECDFCKGKLGYKVTKVEQLYSDVCYHSTGEYTTVIDAEYRKLIRRLQRASCFNCNNYLNFKVKPWHSKPEA